MDTSAYTHLCRAGHAEVIAALAPQGVVVVPDAVNTEIEQGRETYSDIPAVASVPWANVTVLDDKENLTLLRIKARMGGRASEHLGECAVIACAHHRGLVAILDDRAAVAQAARLSVSTRDTLWIVVAAMKQIPGGGRSFGEKVVDDLVATDMFLPIHTGTSIVAHAYEEGWLS